MTESLLGLRRTGDQLQITPCLPSDWSSYKLQYRYQDTMYHITITQNKDAGAVASVTVDGIKQAEQLIALQNDLQTHVVDIVVSSSFRF